MKCSLKKATIVPATPFRLNPDYPCRRPDNGPTGCGPFKPFADKTTILSYHEAPAEVFEDPAEMLIWGRKAFDAALRGRKTKQLKPRKQPRHN